MEQASMEVCNSAVLRGVLTGQPVPSHENHGMQFDRMILSVARLSGTEDHLPVIVRREMAEALGLELGDTLEIEGQVRSYNNRSGQGRKLVISVFARSLRLSAREPENQVFLRGTLCRDPIFRRTPLGREISDVMLAVPRPGGRMDYLPCILWGSLARMASQQQKGGGLWLQGRLQSRDYIKQTEQGPEARVAYEISAITAGPEDQP